MLGYDYLPFGQPLQNASNSLIAQRYGYTSREAHPASPLMYYRYRQYDAGVGRFLARDPLGYVDGTILYAFARQTPARHRDAFGLGCTDKGGGAAHATAATAYALAMAGQYLMGATIGNTLGTVTGQSGNFLYGGMSGDYLGGGYVIGQDTATRTAIINIYDQLRTQRCPKGPGTYSVAKTSRSLTLRNMALGAVIGTGSMSYEGKATVSIDKECDGCRIAIELSFTFSDWIDANNLQQLQNQLDGGLASTMITYAEAFADWAFENEDTGGLGPTAAFPLTAQWSDSCSMCCKEKPVPAPPPSSGGAAGGAGVPSGSPYGLGPGFGGLFPVCP